MHDRLIESCRRQQHVRASDGGGATKETHTHILNGQPKRVLICIMSALFCARVRRAPARVLLRASRARRVSVPLPLLLLLCRFTLIARALHAVSWRVFLDHCADATTHSAIIHALKVSAVGQSLRSLKV